MRVLIYGINFSPEPTGIGRYTGELGEWLVQRGHQVHAVAAPPYYPHWRVAHGYSGWWYRKEYIEAADPTSVAGSANRRAVMVFRCPLWVPRKQTGVRRVLHLISFALSSLPVMLSQILWRPDVIVVVVPSSFYVPQAWLTARLCGARAWLHVQDFEVDAAFGLGLLPPGKLQRVALLVDRWLLRRFDRVSEISKRMVRRLEAKGVARERRVYFPNWVDSDAIRPLPEPSPYRAELGISPDKVVALYSGNMGEKQGLDVLLDVARRLSSMPSIQFVFCGDGAAKRRLLDAGKDLPNVLWLPLQPPARLNELMNLADVHLLPQRPDAADLVMPSKLAGMLASGRPVIATADSGTEVAAVAGAGGLVVQAGDVDALVGAILRLAGNIRERSDLGRRGRRHAVANFGRERVLGRFESDLVSSVAGRDSRRGRNDALRGTAGRRLPFR